MPGAKHITSPTPYASSGDFDRIFHEEKDSLYRLSFLLTADHEKTQRCFCLRTGGFGEGEPAIQGMGAFMGSADDHSERRSSHQRATDRRA
jgi:hypothetical protein